MAQTFIISGKIVDVNTEEPIDNVTIQLKGLPVSTISKEDGSFSIESSKWSNSMELTSVGYKNLTYHLQKDHTTGLLFHKPYSRSGSIFY